MGFVNLNLTPEEIVSADFPLIPPGTYRFLVNAYEVGTTEKGDDKVTYPLEIVEIVQGSAEALGQGFPYTCVLAEGKRFGLIRLAKGVEAQHPGVQMLDGNGGVDFDAPVGKILQGKLTHRKGYHDVRFES